MQLFPLDFVKSKLWCELSHWDFCLLGICIINRRLWVCRCEEDNPPRYSLQGLNLDEETIDYLWDYRRAYAHWFYGPDGNRLTYDGRDLSWFHDKWRGRRPLRLGGCRSE